MQREIKFRAWWKDAELMEEVVSFSEDKVIILVPLKPNSLGQKYERQTLEEGQYELMQFTGLKDKNGKEIYEGDILQWTDGDMWKGVVEWSEGDADFLLDNPQASLGGFETRPMLNGLDSIRSKGYSVIGNIYENPELLK